MSLALRVIGGVALCAVAVAACYEPNFGDDLDDVKLPNRDGSGDAGAHASLPPRGAMTDGADASVSDPATIITTPDASMPDAAPARSAFCSEADLVLCFEFENVVKDGSINALDPASVQNVSFVPGKTGFGASIDTQSAIRFAYSPLWTSPTGAATVEAWVSVSPTANAKSVVFDADGRFAMEIEANGELKCITTSDSVTGGTIVKGQLTHVACTVDGANKIRNYVGGVQKDSGTGRISVNETLGAAIGGNAPSGDPLVGVVDSLRVFRVARTAAEIAQDAQ